MVKLKAVGVHARKGSSGFESSKGKIWYEEVSVLVDEDQIDMIVQLETEILDVSLKEYIKESGNLFFRIYLASTATVIVVAKSIDDLYSQIQTKRQEEIDEKKLDEIVSIKGFVAVDNADTKTTQNPSGRRVAFFPKMPVRDLLTTTQYWAAHVSPYDRICLGHKCFENLNWEDEPVEVELQIIKNE